MQRFRDWIAELPAAGLFIYFTVSFAVLFALLTRTSLTVDVVGGMAFAALMTPLTLVRRRGRGEGRARTEISAAIRLRQLPGLVDPVRWSDALKRRRSALLQQLYVGVPIFAVLGVIEAGQIVSGTKDLLQPIVLLAIAIACVFVAVIPATIQLPRIRDLQSQLKLIYG